MVRGGTMIRETKPKLAKYAFEIGIGRDILSYGEIFAKIHELVKDIPFQEKGPYWQVLRNAMGTMSVTLYINDEELYRQICNIIHGPQKLRVGDKVTVYDGAHAYAHFSSWGQIDKVPDFEYGIQPEVGEYVITYIGIHTPRMDTLVYVINNRYMMDAPAFEKDSVQED